MTGRASGCLVTAGCWVVLAISPQVASAQGAFWWAIFPGAGMAVGLFQMEPRASGTRAVGRDGRWWTHPRQCCMCSRQKRHLHSTCPLGRPRRAQAFREPHSGCFWMRLTCEAADGVRQMALPEWVVGLFQSPVGPERTEGSAGT